MMLFTKILCLGLCFGGRAHELATDQDFQDTALSTTLWRATKYSENDVIDQLLDSSPDAVSARSSDGRGLAWWGFETQNAYVLGAILAYDGDLFPASEDLQGQTPVSVCTENPDCDRDALVEAAERLSVDIRKRKHERARNRETSAKYTLDLRGAFGYFGAFAVWAMASAQARGWFALYHAARMVLSWAVPCELPLPSDVQTFVIFAAGVFLEQRSLLRLRMRATYALQVFASQRYDAFGVAQCMGCVILFAGYILTGSQALFAFSLKLLSVFGESNCLTRNLSLKPNVVQLVMESTLVQELARDRDIVDSTSRVVRRISALMQEHPELQPSVGIENDDFVQNALDKVAGLLHSPFLQCFDQQASVHMARDIVKGMLHGIGEALDDAQVVDLMKQYAQDPEAAIRRQMSQDPIMSLIMGPFMGGSGLFGDMGATGVPRPGSGIFGDVSGASTGHPTTGHRGMCGSSEGHSIPTDGARQRSTQRTFGVEPFHGEGRTLS